MGDLATIDNPIEGLPIQWQSSLVLDLAMGVDKDAICEAYDLQYAQLCAIEGNPSFAARVESTRKDLEKEGASFKLKAQMQAEEYLKTAFKMVHDDDVDPKVRAKLIADTIRWAGFDNASSEVGGSGSGISISINLSNADKPVDGRVFDNGD